MYNSRNFELSNKLYFGFFGRANRFSNFYQSPMIVEAEELNAFGKATDRKINLPFQTAEAFFQWKKAMASPVENRCYRIENSPLDGVICNSIRMASTPAQAKAIGRRSVHMNFKNMEYTGADFGNERCDCCKVQASYRVRQNAITMGSDYYIQM